MVRPSFLVRLFKGSNPFTLIIEKMAEWSKATDCKSARFPFHRFKSYFFQKSIKNMFFLTEFTKLSLFFFIASLLASAILFASFRLSFFNPDFEKVSTYECGFDPYGDARNSFDVRFYLVGLLFLVFDLETVFFFPWSVGLSFMTETGFWGVLDFLVELLAGFFYVWKIGILNWE
jgi:NADH-quinone oxidoreductase subunit A